MPRTFDLIISDLDGCLAPEGAEAFDLDSLAQIAAHNRAAAEKRGGDRPLLTICTGRPQPFVEAFCRLLCNLSAPAIAENGVWMYHPGTNEYSMDPTITSAHITAVRDAAAWFHAALGPRGVSQQPGKAASISLYHADTKFLLSLLPTIREEVARRGWPLRISNTWHYINCDLTHISKATGMERLIRATGLSRDRLAGIGDTPGDLPIRERVAFFACPANAHEEIERVADYVSPLAEARGVVEILKHLTNAQRDRIGT